jgi:dTDP-4-dehydrorhamnose reductase
MKLLITGGAGMLGTDLARAAIKAGHEVAAPSHAELDIADPAALGERMAAERPDVVVNCAAWTDVDGAEDDLEGAMRANADGARNVARAAHEAGALVIFPSTDYVFDGEKREPYVESDPTRPLSVYGQTKLAGEHETREAAARHLIVRTSWLYGHAGKNFVETMLRLGADRDELTVVDDQVGCPTWTRHLAEAIVRLAEAGATGLMHVPGSGHCSWFDFAREIFARAKLTVAVRPGSTAELARPAPRPAWSVMESERSDAVVLPDWREGLRGYLAGRAVRT